jgi:hypothetical protein
MKLFALKARLSVTLSLAVVAGSATFAQAPSGGSPTSINTAFVKLFGTVGAFTAKAEAQVFDRSQKETVRMPMDFALLDGKVRLEIDMAQMQAKDLPPNTLAALKQAGMDRVISIFRPDKKTNYVLYPSIQSYSGVPFDKGEAEVSEKSLTLEKTALGKYTIDGHACVQNKVVVKNGQTPVFEAVTWNAADLKDFPLQIEIREKLTTVRMRFNQVRLVKLDAQQFDVPAKYSLVQ